MSLLILFAQPFFEVASISAKVGRSQFLPVQTTSTFYEADDVPYNIWRKFEYEIERIGQTTIGIGHF